MRFLVVLTIPDYGVKISSKCVANNIETAIDSALDEIALQWITQNPGNTIETAIEECNLAFSVKITPVN